MSRRKFDGDSLLIASHNLGKVREIRALLEPLGVDVTSVAELNLPEPEETGSTFAANAELKALAAATAAGRVALADDSGLVVPALGGDPGIRSARWAGPGGDFVVAMEKVQAALESSGLPQSPGRPAHFVCALTLAWPDGHVETVEGEVHGRLTWPPRGGQGFGYDSMFEPDGYSVTFGEMDPARKHAISHRADAFRKLIDVCFAA